MGQKGYKKSWKKSDKKPVVYKPKRGQLSKLMTEDEKSKAGIHELSSDFGCRITRLFQYLTEDAEAFVAENPEAIRLTIHRAGM